MDHQSRKRREPTRSVGGIPISPAINFGMPLAPSPKMEWNNMTYLPTPPKRGKKDESDDSDVGNE